MTKEEYDDLFDSLTHGHEVFLNMKGETFFFEWFSQWIAIYRWHGETGDEIARIPRKGWSQTVKDLFAFPIWEGQSIDKNYKNIEIIMIE